MPRDREAALQSCGHPVSSIERVTHGPGSVHWCGDCQRAKELQALAVEAAESVSWVAMPRVPGEDNRCRDCRTANTDCTGKCEAYT